MICVRRPFIGAWEHPIMPLTKREAEIRNNPLRSEAAAPRIWNRIQEQMSLSVAPARCGSPARPFARRPGEQGHLSSGVITCGKETSTWEADQP